jgi:PAT family beta-lactamase induction signal transducer AmpG
MPSTNLLESRKGRFIAFGLLYISEGIPFGFATTAMVMFMRLQGLSIEQIGAFVAAVMLPWGFKWAWAPLIDIVKLTRLGGRKAWIMICTAMMIVTLVVMASVDFVANYEVLLWMVILNNIFCATQDVAIDSLAVSTLRDDERATGNGFMFGGQYLGIALGGGGAIYVSSLVGFNASIIFVSGLLVLSLLFVVVFIRDPYTAPLAITRRVSAFSHFVATLGAFVRNLYDGFMLSGRGPRLGLLFAILPCGALALAYAILGTLQVDYGLEQDDIAKLSVLNTIAGGIGCLIGGILADRLGIKKIIGLFYCLTAVPTLYLAFQIGSIGLAAIPIEQFFAAVILHGLMYGGAFAVAAAIFMGMTSPAVAATQFTAYMALGNIAISIGNFWQGIVAERIGYSAALYLDAALILAPLAVLPFLRNRESPADTATLEPALAAD